MWKNSLSGSDEKNSNFGQLSALAGAFLLMFCFGILNASIGYYVAPVSEELGVGRGTFNMHFTLMMGISLFTSPVIARKVLPKTGETLLVVIGAFVCSFGLLLFSFADSMWEFFAVSILVGSIQLACTNIIAVSTVARCFPEKSGLAMGIAMAGSGINNFVMSAVLPSCIENYGWRFGYRFQSILFLAMALLAAYLIKGKTPFEIKKTVPAATKEPGNHRDTRSASLVFFIIAAFIVNLCTSFLTQLPAYLGDFDISVLTLSTIMSVASVVLTLSKVVFGYFYDVIGKKPTIIFVLTVFAVSFLTLTIDSVTILAISSATISIGMASQTVLTPLISKDVFGGKNYTAVWAIINASSLTGGALGSTVWGLVYDFAGSYNLGMYTAPILLLLAMFIWLRQIRQAKC